MEATLKETWRAIAYTLILAALTGLVYPLVATGVSQVVFSNQANGSLIYRGGQVVGSSLMGQRFTSAKYFHGRPSATTDANTGKPLPYNAANSAGSNLGPSNPALLQRVQGDVAALRKDNPTLGSQSVPVDLVTTDFSGVDPDISPAAALLQVDRVASARGLDAARVRALVMAHIDGPIFGLFGEPHVNVLLLNLALDAGAAR